MLWMIIRSEKLGMLNQDDENDDDDDDEWSLVLTGIRFHSLFDIGAVL